jgi:hypothetical protein
MIDGIPIRPINIKLEQAVTELKEEQALTYKQRHCAELQPAPQRWFDFIVGHIDIVPQRLCQGAFPREPDPRRVSGTARIVCSVSDMPTDRLTQAT